MPIESKSLAVVVLAAGLGKRMRSNIPKVAHQVGGVPLIQRVLNAVSGLKPCRTLVVVGKNSGVVRSILGDEVEYVVQGEPLGTGHAVMCAMEALGGWQGPVLVVNGDTPLLDKDELKFLLETHVADGNAATLVTAVLDDPSGFGRIVRNEDGELVGIVEDADATDKEKALREINAGVYCFETEPLLRSLTSLMPANAQGEYYIVDVVGDMVRRGLRVGTICTKDPSTILGINTRAELAMADQLLVDKVISQYMDSGVTFLNKCSVRITDTVEIGRDSIVGPAVEITGNSKIGTNCRIGPEANLKGVTLGNNVSVALSSIAECTIGGHSVIGPFTLISSRF